MYEWSLLTQCCVVSEISCVNGVMRKERIIIIIIIIITRMLQLQATVKRFLFDLQFDLEGQHTFTSLWFQRQVM